MNRGSPLLAIGNPAVWERQGWAQMLLALWCRSWGRRWDLRLGEFKRGEWGCVCREREERLPGGGGVDLLETGRAERVRRVFGHLS